MQLPLILAGGVFAVASIMAAGRLIAPRTPLAPSVRFTTGAAALSLCIFFLLACHAGYLSVYLALGSVLVIAAWRARTVASPALNPLGWFYRAVFAVYGAMYLIYALAPEIEPDAAGYHLRLVSDYVRLHGLSTRAGFYDVLPQGMEMLFVPAFAIGAGSAAKLVHFTFLIAAVWLIREIARELNVAGGGAAAALFFLAPVCGVAGTSAYTDAGLVCACCSVLWLLIRWERERTIPYLVCAALNAGFCYAIKPTFGCVAIFALGFIAFRCRKPSACAAFAGVAVLTVVPWVLRADLLAGSPVAPFLSAWLPNNVSTPETERHLMRTYGAFRTSFSWLRAPLDYSLRGGNQGVFGPAFLLLPLGLALLGKKNGRFLIGASCALALPFLANTGSRFLMPAMASASLTLASVLPAPATAALVAIQAIGSLPQAVALYQKAGEWRLGDIPFAAALRLTPEPEYLARSIPDFNATRMITSNTPEGAGVFACAAVAEAYVPRELLGYWHSAVAQRFTDALHLAMISQGTRARLLSWRWNEDRYRSLRVTALSDLRVIEASLTDGNAHGASWKFFRTGESLSLLAPPGTTGASLLIWPGDQARETSLGQLRSGGWAQVDDAAERTSRNIDLRRDATAYIRRSGYRFILIRAAGDAFAEIGMDMARHASEWGVVPVGREGDLWLFDIQPQLL